MATEASRRTPSIVGRLSRSVLLVVVIGSAVGAVASALAVSLVVRSLMDSALEETAQALVVLAEHEDDVEALAHGRVLPAAPHRETLVWQLRASDGKLVARSHDAPAAPWDVPLFEGHQYTADLAVFTVAGQRLWLQVAQPLDNLRRAQITAAMQAGITVILLGALAALIIGWRIQAELRPVLQMARDVESIEPMLVRSPLPRSPRRELEPVYAALESLLDRLSRMLRSEHAFASHAAHSLRTPLAGLTAQLAVARLHAPDKLASRIDLAMDAARRLDGVVGGLLAMARMAGPVAWAPFAAHELGRVAMGSRIRSDVSALEDAAPLRGNVDLLSAALANLVDNAARHGASQVRIETEVTADTQRIKVTDDGPGIATAKLQTLRDALARFNETGEISATLGLGLTLAAAVARAHGGQIDLLCDDAPASGLRVHLSWPRTAQRG